MLELSIKPNTFPLKALVALHEKGLDFNSRYVDFCRWSSTDCALRRPRGLLSIEGEAPVLVHDGAVISDSFQHDPVLDEVA
jgi:glutathione S-transferase